MTTTLQGFINGAGIHSNIHEDWNNNSPEWAQDKRHYKVQLRHDGRSMSLWFYQGIMAKEPTTADILGCILSDYGFSHMNSVDDYIDELGVSISSAKDFREAERTFKQLEKQNKRTLNLFGAELLSSLLEADW